MNDTTQSITFDDFKNLSTRYGLNGGEERKIQETPFNELEKWIDLIGIDQIGSGLALTILNHDDCSFKIFKELFDMNDSYFKNSDTFQTFNKILANVEVVAYLLDCESDLSKIVDVMTKRQNDRAIKNIVSNFHLNKNILKLYLWKTDEMARKFSPLFDQKIKNWLFF